MPDPLSTNDALAATCERALLGAILGESGEASGRLLAVAALELAPPIAPRLVEPKHRMIGLALDAVLRGQGSSDVESVASWLDSLTVSDALDLLAGRQRSGKPTIGDTALTAVGGYTALAGMIGEASARDATAIRAIARQVAHAHQAREAFRVLRSVAQAVIRSDLTAGPGMAIADGLERLGGMIGGLRERELGSCLVSALEIGARRAQARAGGMSPASWGIPALDAVVPMRPGGLYVLAAPPKIGKTSLALQAAARTANAGGRDSVAIVSLEMTGEELATILAGREMGIAPAAIREQAATITPAMWERLADLAARWRAESAVHVKDTSASGEPTTAAAVSSWLRHRRLVGGPRLALTVVDYLQILDGADPRQTEYQRITDATRLLKRAAMQLQVPILVLSQMSRKGREAIRQRTTGQVVAMPEPTLADLRGTGAIEQDADAVVFIHRPHPAAPTDGAVPVQIIVAANRAGGEAVIECAFHRRQQLFEQLAVDADDAGTPPAPRRNLSPEAMAERERAAEETARII